MQTANPVSAQPDPLLSSALQGDTAARYRLAQQYQSGKNRPADARKAATWFLMAATQGHIEAQFQLGNAYATGQGVPRLPKRARHWWQKAARQGHPAASTALASLAMPEPITEEVTPDPVTELTREETRAEPGTEPERRETVDNTAVERPSPAEAAVVPIAVAIQEPAETPPIADSVETTAPAEEEPAEEPLVPTEPHQATPIEPQVVPLPPADDQTDIKVVSGYSSPDEEVAPALRIECAAWLSAAPHKGFTIQLIATHRLSSVMTYLERHQLEDSYSLCAYDEYNALWFAIFYGQYETLQAARAGLDALPDKLKRSKPYFRNLNKMRQLIRQE